MKPHRILTAILVTVLLAFVYGCAGMWTAAKKSSPSVAGGAAGALVGGPVGAGIGAGAGAIIGDSIVENDDLRSGDLVGAAALTREIQRQAAVIAAMRGDIAGARAALSTEEHRIDWLKWISLAALVLVALKWLRTLWVDYNKAKAMELPVMASMVKGVDAVLRKQVTQ